MPTIDPQTALSAAFLAAVVVSLVSAIRAVLPKIDGKPLVGLCCLVVGVGASLLLGGAPWRLLALRGLLAGVGAFGIANTWQWSKGPGPEPTDRVGGP